MADEITPEELARLNELLAEGPGDDASEEEVAAFMKKFVETPGGEAMLQSLAEQMQAGGGDLLDALAGATGERSSSGKEEVYREPKSTTRLVARAAHSEKKDSWCRLTLPADASFFDWHRALEGVFAEAKDGEASHAFEWWEERHLVAVFCGDGVAEVGADVFCEYQNGPLALFSEGADRLVYRLGEQRWEVLYEKLIDAKSADWTAGPTAHRLAGSTDITGQ